MRTILPFASNPLLQMSPTQTTEAHDHAPAALNPQELSRSASPQQSNLSLLVRAVVARALRASPYFRYRTAMPPFARPRQP